MSWAKLLVFWEGVTRNLHCNELTQVEHLECEKVWKANSFVT